MDSPLSAETPYTPPTFPPAASRFSSTCLFVSATRRKNSFSICRAHGWASPRTQPIRRSVFDGGFGQVRHGSCLVADSLSSGSPNDAPAVFSRPYAHCAGCLRCTHGFLRPVVDGVVEEYLRFGDLHEGFAGIRCSNPECKNEYLLALSCKGHWFCQRCHSNKTIQFGEDVKKNVWHL